MRTKPEELIVNFEFFKENKDDRFYIYIHYTNENVPFYVGKGIKNRCCHKTRRSIWWKRTVKKYGYYIKIEEINLTESQAFKREKYWISKFGRKQFNKGGTLVNLTDGGEGVIGKIFTEEERKEISNRCKENPDLWSKGGDREKYFGKKLYGQDNPNYGNKYENNPISKPVIKLDLKGNFICKYTSATEAEEKNNVTGVSANCNGKRNQLCGFKYVYEKDYISNNFNIKLGKTNKRPVYMIDIKTDSIIKEYESSSSTKKDGFAPRNVSQVCLGEKKTHLGYKWCYVSDYEEKYKIINTNINKI